MTFAYLRRGLRLDEIEAYVEGYDFGAIPPDLVVLHHTAIPFTTWAPVPGRALTDAWDANEQGLSERQIYTKRLRQLDAVKNVYEITNGWSAGPHLFIDERYVWLMTPMNQPGIHAKWFNSFRSNGRLHYSIGVEMLGCYTKVARWHPNQERLLATFVGALQRKLKTFTLDALYSSHADGPGMVTANGVQRCAHPERLRAGGITDHSFANKPECPGYAITPAYYLGVLRNGAGDIHPVESTAAAAEGSSVGRYRVTADTLNVRDKPALRGSNVVHTLAKGRIITVDVIKHDEGGDSTVWAHMDRKNPEGDKGFVSLKWLEKVG